ncbi:MAG: hypothetical protein ACTSV1_02805 [Alphaproteobacteria bacterium]
MTAQTKNWVNSPRVQSTADGIQTVFDFSFSIFENGDLEVYVASTLKDHVVDYVVNDAGSSTGGSVSFNTAPANGDVVTLRRKMPIDSTNDLPTLTATVQDTAVEQERSLHLTASDPDGDMTLPDKATRSNRFLKFDASGNPEAVDNATSYTISPYMETVVDDVDAATARTTLGLGTAAVENVAAGGTGDLLRTDGDGSSLTGISSAFMATVLDDTDAATARATLGALANVVEDTTPQLGGDLDPNGHVIGWSKGANIASASPLVLGTDGNYFDVTGTTGFSAITVAANTLFMLHFDGVLTLTHGAPLNLLGAANIVTAAGDEAICFATAANTVRVISYSRSDGSAVSSSGGGWEHVESITLSNATYGYLGEGVLEEGYDYIVTTESLTNNGTDSDVCFNLGTGVGPTYGSTFGATVHLTYGTTDRGVAAASGSGANFLCTSSTGGATAGEIKGGEIIFLNPAVAAETIIKSHFYCHGNTAEIMNATSAGFSSSTAAGTGIRFGDGSANNQIGTLHLGRRKVSA